MSSDAGLVLARTRQWVEQVVVGHNFCPFAKPSLAQTHYQLLAGDVEQRMQGLLAMCAEMRARPELETALLVVAAGLTDFDDYLDELALAESLLEELGFAGEFQLASFHPDYCFADTDPGAAENYTNRSPYPVFHLLREASISKALAAVKLPEKIPQRNQRYAQQLGQQRLQAELDQCSNHLHQQEDKRV